MIVQENIYKVGDVITWVVTTEVENADLNATATVQFSIPNDFEIVTADLEQGTYVELPVITSASNEFEEYHLSRKRYEWIIDKVGIYKMRLNLRLVNDPPLNTFEYFFNATKLFGEDTRIENNVLQDSITFKRALDALPTGSTVPAISCGCDSLSDYSSYVEGYTPKWVINDSIENGIVYDFDSKTGDLVVKHIDPTKKVVFNWDFYLVDSDGVETLISQNEIYMIPPLFTDISFVNHKRYIGKASDLSEEENETYSELFDGWNDDVCIDYMRNSVGEITTLAVIDCTTRENLNTVECLDESYQALTDCDSCDDPKDKVNFSDQCKVGDVHTVKFNDGMIVHYEFTELNGWEEVCKIDYQTKEDYPKDLVGKLCDSEGRVVYVFNKNGEVTYQLTDKTDYLGNMLDLGECCCDGESSGSSTGGSADLSADSDNILFRGDDGGIKLDSNSVQGLITHRTNANGNIILNDGTVIPANSFYAYVDVDGSDINNISITESVGASLTITKNPFLDRYLVTLPEALDDYAVSVSPRSNTVAPSYTIGRKDNTSFEISFSSDSNTNSNSLLTTDFELIIFKLQ